MNSGSKSVYFFRVMLVLANIALLFAPKAASGFPNITNLNREFIPLSNRPNESKQLISQSAEKNKPTPTGLVPAPPPETFVPPPPPGIETVYPAGNHPPVSINTASGSLDPNDITGSLSLKPGMVINFQIQSGVDTRWKHVGNYNFEAKIEFNDQRGYAFDWHM